MSSLDWRRGDVQKVKQFTRVVVAIGAILTLAGLARAGDAQLNLPVGAIVASHSFRELGATMAIKARYSPALSADHGLWRRIATMHERYFFAEFPYSRWLAAMFDFLATR